MRDASGNITEFNAVADDSTYMGGLNSKGAVCGDYVEINSKGNLGRWAFIRKASGKITTYPYPRNKRYTGCTGINASNVATGWYTNNFGRNPTGGYIRTP